MRAQQIPYPAKPTEKGGKGEAIDRGHAGGRMTVRDLRVRDMKMGVSAEVKVAGVGVTAAGEEREHTQQETKAEADEIEEFPRHFCFTEFRAVRRVPFPGLACDEACTS